MNRDELYKEIQYIVVVMLDQFFYPTDLSIDDASAINKKETYAIERYQNDPLFYARVNKMTYFIVEKILSLIEEERCVLQD